jgi:hypothetical protein
MAVQKDTKVSKPVSKPLSKGAPPPPQRKDAPTIVEKPTAGSFKDRIAAFNNPKAAPVTPFKPSGMSGVKKPFIPPPPSKDAYIPAPRPEPAHKVYRREEDPEVVARTSEDRDEEERAPPPQMPLPSGEADNEEQPKPTSLKERIALLQKQQAEQAARHAEGASKKDKVKRPPKKRADSSLPTEATAGDNGSEAELGDDAAGPKRPDVRRETGETTNLPARQRLGAEPSERRALSAVPRDLASDANDADQSGAGDTEDAEETSTGVEDSDDKPRKAPAPPAATSTPPSREADVGDEEDNTDDDVDNDEEKEERDAEGEEEMDPEERKRLEIRQRMAKMSGGMGMHGMFGPPGALPPPMPRTGAKKPVVSDGRSKSSPEDPKAATSPSTQAPPVPLLPISTSSHPAEPAQVERESPDTKQEGALTGNITSSRAADEVPDVEDVAPEPVQLPKPDSRRQPPPPPRGMCLQTFHMRTTSEQC